MIRIKNAADRNISTPLDWAVEQNNVAIANLLIDSGVDADSKSEDGERA
jgi:ankyrin repeat protein